MPRKYTGLLAEYDFRSLQPGQLTLSNFTRADATTCATVQTGTSINSSVIPANYARVGRILDSYNYGFLIEETRINILYQSVALASAQWQKLVGTETLTASQGIAPDFTKAAALSTGVAGGVFQTPSIAWVSSTKYACSTWIVGQSGNNKFQLRTPLIVGTSNQLSGDITCTTAWQRTVWTPTVTTGGSSSFVIQTDVASDAISLYVWGAQVEVGNFATSLISTPGLVTTRAGDRWQVPLSSHTLNGRIGIEMRIIPIAANTAYSGTPYLFANGSTDYATINPSNGYITVVTAGGASFTTTSGVTWNANDVVDIWIEAGGGSSNTVVKTRVNSGTTLTLGTSVSPQGNVASTGMLDILNNAAANQLSCFVNYVNFSPNCIPSWAQ